MPKLSHRIRKGVAFLRNCFHISSLNFLQKENIFWRQYSRGMRRIGLRKLQLPILIGLGGLAIAASVFAVTQFNSGDQPLAQNTPQWTQKAGEGISVPACGSSSASAPTCSGTTPSVTFDWTVDTSGPYITPDDVQVIITQDSNGAQVFNQFICGDGAAQSCNQLAGSWTWTGGISSTAYTWLMYQHHYNSIDALIGSGSFTTTNCAPAAGTIQGYKVKMPGNTLATPPSNETVTLDGASPTTANPYFFTGLSSGNYIVAVSVPSGWSVGYTACTNDTTCHGNSPTPGSSASVTVPSGGYVDLWWHYTPPPGTIVFAAMLDGAPWGIQGVDSVIVNGSTPNSPVSNLTVPLNSYPNAPVGSYTYNFADPPGGPPGANPQSVTPAASQSVIEGGTTIWTFNFVTAALTNNASCGAINVPATVTAGQPFAASVTMNNTGTKPWATDATPHRLGSANPQDNLIWGTGRVSLPFSPINPGSAVTFFFNPTAPSTPGTYSFDWRMVEDGVEWFGPVCSSAPIIVASQTHLGCSNNSCAVLSGPPPNTDGCTAVGQACGVLPTPPTVTDACTGDGVSRVNISWSAGNGSSGYGVDIDNDNPANWGNGYWNKGAAPGITNTTAPDDFNGYGGQSGPLTLTAGSNYQVRVYYAADGTHSQTGTFVAPSCPINPGQGEIRIRRVDDTFFNIAGTEAVVIGVGQKSENPAIFPNLAVGAYTVGATDLAGYIVDYGKCEFPVGGTQCSVLSFPYVPNCDGTWCTVSSFGVTANMVNRIVFHYLLKSLSVVLDAYPSSGPAPLNGVDLTATVTTSMSGTKNYTFYCNRSDTGTNITAGWNAKYDSEPANFKDVPDLCNYPTAGTIYTAKVIVEQGALADQAQQTITVGGGGSTLTPTCNVVPATAALNQLVTWSGSASGGTPPYLYSWTGTDGLTCTGQPSSACWQTTKTYSTSGQKSGTFTVTDAVSASAQTSACSTNAWGGVDVATPILRISPPSIGVQTGQNFPASAWYDPDGAGTEVEINVTTMAATNWTSADNTIATVNDTTSKGLVTGIKVGTTQITATYTYAAGKTLTKQAPVIVTGSLRCGPSVNPALFNQPVTFTAIGGTSGAYTWDTASQGIPASCTTSCTSSFPTKFPTTGLKTVHLTRGLEAADCTISIITDDNGGGWNEIPPE